MSMVSSLRAKVRPALRRLRALLGANPQKPIKTKPLAAPRGARGKARKPVAPAPPAMVAPPARPVALAPAKAATPVRAATGRKARRKGTAEIPPARGAKAANPAPQAAAGPRASRQLEPVVGKPWNILFLGGSNTVMRNGYVDALIASLEDRLGPVSRITNLAAGGNSTVHGLMLAMQQPDLADYDIVVIEYGVNDVKLAKPDGIDAWKGATEGLVRRLLAARPDMHVVFALFGRRDMQKRYMFRPAESTVELAAHYAPTQRVTLVDIDHLFRDVLFRDEAEFAGLYVDRSHYRRPAIARLVGALIASGILGAPTRAAAPLPGPLYPWHFAGAELVDLVGDPETARVFANSRYTVPTRPIGLGETLTIKLPGAIAGIEFVAIPTAATLVLREEGEAPVALHTRHSRTGEANYPFLLRCRALENRPWASGRRGPRKVVLEVVADAPEKQVKKGLNMVAAEPGTAEGIFLTRFLCIP